MPSKDQYTEMVKEIELLITYGVQDDERQQALGFLAKIRRNRVALMVLKDFYSSLPGAEEEPVIGLALLDSGKGVFLLGVDGLHHHYLYFATEEKVGCLGFYEEGIEDQEVLSYFGFASNEEFKKRYPDPKKLTDFGTAEVTERVVCPVCFVEEGEIHQLGCVVEVCPWCDEQLSRCNCRFDKMELEELQTEEDLAEFEELLETKGRIVFAKEQVPAYPSDSDGHLEDGKTNPDGRGQE